MIRERLARLIDRVQRPGIAPQMEGGRPATVEEMLPRPGLFSVGAGDFRAIGEKIVAELKATCALAPHHRVLDVGCGTGRIAIPLTQYLSSEGRYEGFDPVAKAIRHCRTRITPSYPNFHFQVADLYNRRYNRRGRIKDFEYRFPYPDATFDVVFAVSVLTHLLPEGTERYISESSRVLKPGGRFFATWFLLNEESKAALDAGKSSISFPRSGAAHRLHNARNPEAAVAYDEGFIVGLYAKHGLTITPPLGYGFWSGRAPSGYDGYQDRLVATK